MRCIARFSPSVKGTLCSQGLDPASRRQLWDTLRAAKAGRAMILTTHSMEEAEVLCDRLGIFVDGQLVTLGYPKQLAARYAGFLVQTHS
jgi:ABC-type multidrug transport system ATPase subunit